MRALASLAVVATLSLSFSACKPERLHGKGGKCHSLSDCAAGLACVDGKCSADLDDLRGRVPTYPAETPPEAGAETTPPPEDAASTDAGSEGG